MSAHESMEQADQAKEAAGENRKIALLIAVIALCLALSETLGKGAQTESISKNVEASNLWAFFQAKSIRRTTVQTAAEQSKLSLGTIGEDAAKAAAQKQIDDWQKTAERYRSDPKTGEGQDQLSERAKHAEEERDLAEAKYHHFELASAAFQIGIVLASATIITGIIALSWISGLLTLAGIAFTALGIFVPHLLHLPKAPARLFCRGAVLQRRGVWLHRRPPPHRKMDVRIDGMRRQRPKRSDVAQLSALRARSCENAGSAAACAPTSCRRRHAVFPGFGA